MSVTTRNRVTSLGKFFILVLVINLVVFAVYLKASPGLYQQLPGTSSSQAKLWVDPSQALNIKLKIAVTPLACLFFLVFVAFQNCSWAMRPSSAAVFWRNELFNGSRHWFRPPPHFIFSLRPTK